jgi:hypothetical protein
MLVLGEIGPHQLCACAFAWQSHSVDEHEGKKHCEICQCFEKGIKLLRRTPPPKSVCMAIIFLSNILSQGSENH